MVMTMKKFAKIVNIISFGISALTIAILVVLVALYSIPADIKVHESNIEINSVNITKRQSKKEVTYYATNLEKNMTFYVVLGFDLYDLEQHDIHLTIQDSSISYIVTVNKAGIASLVYSFNQ